MRFVQCNGKSPIENDWVNEGTSKELVAKRWLDEGYNVGMITGEDYIIVDKDGAGDLSKVFGRELPETTEVWNGNPDKKHLYYKNNKNLEIHTSPKVFASWVDVLGVGRQALIPGCTHPDTGNKYEYVNGRSVADAEELPDWLAKMLLHPPPYLGNKWTEGDRNSNLAKYMGWVVNQDLTDDRMRELGEEAVRNRYDPPADREEWKKASITIDRAVQKFERKQKREVKQAQEREAIVEHLTLLGCEFKLNQLDDTIEVNGEAINDITLRDLHWRMRVLGHNNMAAIDDAIAYLAKSKEYHPIKNYLESLVWDGLPNITALASYFEDEQHVFGTFFRKWMIGAVDRVYTGQHNPMLVVEGEQGGGKSYFVRWIASPLGHYFIESDINPQDKDYYVRLANTWIWEVKELGATTRKADREALKAFISTEKVSVRKAYDRFDTRKPALASFIGTLNNEAGFLSDPTGERRYLTIPISKIDWNYTNIDPNQLWAEAVAAWNAGEDWHLNEEEKSIQESINEDYKIYEPIEDKLEDAFNFVEGAVTRADVILAEMRDEILGVKYSNDKARSMDIAKVLRSKGCKSGKRRVDGKKRAVWIGLEKA